MEVQWPLVIFTLFVCLGAGVFAMQGLLCVLGKGEKSQVPAVIAAAGAVALGGIASFLHLQHWDRAFNGFGQLSSGITQELISIVVLFIVMAVFFAVGRKGLAPKWAGILAIVVSIAVVALMTTSYLMPARPVWSTPLLYLFYFAQAFAAGAAGVWLLSCIGKDADSASLMVKCTAIGGIAVVASLLAYAAYVGTVSFDDFGSYWDSTVPTAALVDNGNLVGQLLAGGLALPFWLAVLVGGVVPAVLAFLKWKDGHINLSFAAVSLVCILVGGIAFRAVLYLLGFPVFAIF
ncbi:MAG: dimethyl sulfoxide reductase anchor subunit [Eggerthellaceae bacterium]|jgi:anaerobic dimethyl sulfoxide reductase subunit C (anchor subunit)|nr:dimethyl sulfoxide reductase anchor subunit [Eggerthellaceae bacterium]MDR2715572.1 dimethyl sulfoxide reductase anchor subunit [Coriobacteriaceae bacterium]